MVFSVNGREHELPEGSTVAELIAELALDPRMLAVECNLELVPRSLHAQTHLQEGDRVEVVTLVGGG